MSSSKVSSGAPVGHTTSMIKLGNVRSASSNTTTVSAVGDSGGVDSATDQYLTGQDSGFASDTPKKHENVPNGMLEPVLNLESEAQLTLQEPNGSMYSIQEMEQYIEKYEQTIERSEMPLKKKTQGFG